MTVVENDRWMNGILCRCSLLPDIIPLTMNRWGIPKDIENRVRKRDRKRVYCHVRLKERVPKGSLRKALATWEHINNDHWDDATIMELNVVRCCNSCNASKGRKTLLAWLRSEYCGARGISLKNIAPLVKAFLEKCRNLA